MRRIIAYIIAAVMFLGCATIRPVPVNTETVFNYIDSLVIKDSVRVVELPVERITDIIPIYDTLELETSLAGSKTWLDTTFHMLRGEIHNKPQASLPTPYEEHIVYRDSTVTKEVPVEVEKIVTVHPKYEPWLWIYVIVSILAVGLYIYIKNVGFPLIHK